jgi:hypothetical protein
MPVPIQAKRHAVSACLPFVFFTMRLRVVPETFFEKPGMLTEFRGKDPNTLKTQINLNSEFGRRHEKKGSHTAGA